MVDTEDNETVNKHTMDEPNYFLWYLNIHDMILIAKRNGKLTFDFNYVKNYFEGKFVPKLIYDLIKVYEIYGDLPKSKSDNNKREYVINSYSDVVESIKNDPSTPNDVIRYYNNKNLFIENHSEHSLFDDNKSYDKNNIKEKNNDNTNSFRDAF